MNNKNKTLAIIDYANIKSWLREKEFQIDLEILKQGLAGMGIGDIRFYYGKDNKNKGIQNFFDTMQGFGYTVITKPVQYFKIKLSALMKQKSNSELVNRLSKKLRLSFLTEVNNLEKTGLVFLQPKANFDVEISLDVLERMNDYNNFVLFSGDGDFVPLVEKLQENGKWVVVVSGRKYFSGLLRKKSNVSVSMELLIEILPELVFLKTQRPVDKQQVFKKCILSVATLNRLSSLFYKTGDKK